MTDPTQPEGMTALLLQLAALTEKLSGVEHRHAGEVREIRDRLAAVAAAAEQVKAAVAGQAEALAALNGLDAQVADLAARLGPPAPSGGSGDGTGYQPSPSPKFWKLDGPDREETVGKLRAWVEQVFRPGYGHLAAGLGDCWDQHPLCLYLLDWLSELWSVLYLGPARTTATLAGQAEWHTRLLPAAAGQLARETRGCSQHTGRRRQGQAQPGARP